MIFDSDSTREGSPSRALFYIAATLASLSAGLLTSCSDAGSSEITTKREISEYERARPVAVDTKAEERFRFASMGMSSRPASAPPAAGGGDAAGAGNGGAKLIWDTPEGWNEVPASSMRDISLTFGPNGEAECYVARLPGAAGGLDSNINRWRKQMGQGDLTTEEIAALPKQEIFGVPATYVSIDGSYTGMGGKLTIDEARMLGMVLMTPNGALFVKAIGPQDLVAANTENFEAFCASLRLE